ncbi:MAG: hypothetical protein E7272_07545 [Pseudobutyrivibrio ruminis]|uniref:Uncharacterized protein n=1 Tax=Pseudobutyrivibrio ruminis TaxID=46206 RepID=A0A927U801_9FIRM|nr:hypothetical protein [Pseudobutyrivibrio ruminis]
MGRPIDEMIRLFDADGKHRLWITKRFANYLCSQNSLWEMRDKEFDDGCPHTVVEPTGTTNGKKFWAADIHKVCNADDLYTTLVQTRLDENGNYKYIRTETDLYFKMVDNHIKVDHASCLGASEFTLEESDTDDIEAYWPGLLKQLEEMLVA